MNIVDQQTFRDAMSCMGAAVNIITTDGPAGRAGFTASAVCSALSFLSKSCASSLASRRLTAII